MDISIADLTQPYAAENETSSFQMDRATEGHIEWMEANPGRWALTYVGLSRSGLISLRKLGYEQLVRLHPQSRLSYRFTRKPAPGGVDLDEALECSPWLTFPEQLPYLQVSRFDWTPDELDDAVQWARNRLFPVKAIRKSRAKALMGATNGSTEAP